jgi:hypothetical protein
MVSATRQHHGTFRSSLSAHPESRNRDSDPVRNRQGTDEILTVVAKCTPINRRDDSKNVRFFPPLSINPDTKKETPYRFSEKRGLEGKPVDGSHQKGYALKFKYDRSFFGNCPTFFSLDRENRQECGSLFAICPFEQTRFMFGISGCRQGIGSRLGIEHEANFRRTMSFLPTNSGGTSDGRWGASGGSGDGAPSQSREGRLGSPQ